MNCPKCKSENINIVSEQTNAITNNRSLIHVVGRLILIICTCGLWLLIPKKKAKTKFKNKTVGICQSCGYKFTT